MGRHWTAAAIAVVAALVNALIGWGLPQSAGVGAAVLLFGEAAGWAAARRTVPPKPPAPDVPPSVAHNAALRLVSPAELRVIRLLAKNMTDREIAHAIYRGVRTVETHLANIRTRHDLKNRLEIVDWARRNGLLEEEHEETRTP
jgi:DNA-binding CsgD family transcriptional regulator